MVEGTAIVAQSQRLSARLRSAPLFPRIVTFVLQSRRPKNPLDMVAQELRIMSDDLEGCSLADVFEKLEKGKIGYRAAMEWLNVSSLSDLVEIMHVKCMSTVA